MSYDPGSVVDLSYINKKTERKSSASVAGQFLVDIGTSFKLVLTEAGSYTCARRIEVALG